MNSVYIDENIINECGNNILLLTEDLKKNIDLLFLKLSQVNTTGKVWYGSASDAFVQRCKVEKIEYDKYVEILKQYGTNLKNISELYNTISK